MNCLSSSFFAILTILLLVSASAKKKDRNLPQGHFGILKGYEPGAFDLALKSSDEKDLNNGKSVMKQSLPKKGEDDGGGGAICVQDIQAPKDAVWRQILLLDEYEKKVAKVMECKNYEVKNRGDGTFNIKTRMKLGVMPGYSYENYYDHVYHKDTDSLTWRLDYDKTSDFNDVSGHWHLEEHPSKPGCTRVFYACDIKLRGAVPGPVLNFIGKSALRQATAWVKKESEAAPEATIPNEFGGPAGGGEAAKTAEPAAAGRFGFASKISKSR